MLVQKASRKSSVDFIITYDVKTVGYENIYQLHNQFLKFRISVTALV